MYGVRLWVLPSLIWQLVGCGAGATEGIVLVTSGGSDHVLAIDAASGTTRDSIPVDPRPGEGDEPHGIVVSPLRDYWYVTVSHGNPTLWKFTWPGNRRVGRVRLGISGASRIGLSPDGRTGYVPDYYRDDPDVLGKIAVVRLHTLEVLATPDVCLAPHDAQVSASGQRLAVACSGGNDIVFLNTATLEMTRRVSFASSDADHVRPLNLVWLPGDTSVVVTLHHTSQVARYWIGDDRIERVSVGAGPAQLALSPDGNTMVTANRLDGTASIVSVTPMSEVTRVDLGVAHPHGVAFSDEGTVVFITYEGTTDTYGGVLALDIQDRTVRWDVPAGAYTLGVTHVTPE